MKHFLGSTGNKNPSDNAGDMGSILVWEDYTCGRAAKSMTTATEPEL